MVDTNRTEEIGFPELLQLAVEARLVDQNICLPGIIESYDRATQTAKVQPALKRTYVDDRIVNLPIINRVPIIFPRSGGTHIHFDLKKGDYVTLIFSQRSLDLWKEKGGLVSPNDPRKFHLSDAYGIPGGTPRADAFAPRGGVDSLELTNESGDNTFSLEKDGSIKIKTTTGEVVLNKDGSLDFKGAGDTALNIKESGEMTFTNGTLTFTLKDSGKVVVDNGAFELITVLSDVVTEIIGAQTLTLLGPQNLIGQTKTFPLLKTQLDTFKE